MAWPTCSFCGLERSGGVAGPALSDVYICPDCIRLAGEIVKRGEPEDPHPGA